MKFDVISIGTVTWDTFIKASFLKTLPDLKKAGGKTAGVFECLTSGSKFEITEPISSAGGGAFNSAVTFARAGMKAAVLCNFGEDWAGDFIKAEIEKEGIKILGRKISGSRSARSFVLLNRKGERTILVFRGDSGSLEDSFKKAEAEWVYIAPGSMSFSFLKKAVDYFHSRGTAIALNPSKDLIRLGIRKIKPLLNKTKAVILNREEAAYLTRCRFCEKGGDFQKVGRICPWNRSDDRRRKGSDRFRRRQYF